MKGIPKHTFISPKERDRLWHEEYCEWKWGELLNYVGNNIKCEISTDCGEKIIYTRDNKYGKLLEKEGVHCPFCGKLLTICDYE